MRPTALPSSFHFVRRGLSAIPRIIDLQTTIGQALALQSVPMAGKEARFLRQHLGLKAKEWAAFLHVDTATLSRWENGGQMIGPQADSLIRLMYFCLLAEKQGCAIPEHLADQVAAAVTYRTDAMVLLINPNESTIGLINEHWEHR